MSSKRTHNVLMIVPRQYCNRDTMSDLDQAQLSSSLLVKRTVVEESCPSLADSGATRELVRKMMS